jgi:hypothetical protein
MFNQDISKYAFLKTFGEFGYGHFHATLYNLTEKHYGGPVLVVTSQIGTSYDPPLKDQEIYAWRWGAEAAHSRDGLSLYDMELMLKPMRKIQKRLDKLQGQLGAPRNFQEFLFRLLISADLDYVITNKDYGGGYACQLEELPMVDMSYSWAATDLRRVVDEMAEGLIERFYPGEKKEAA